MPVQESRDLERSSRRFVRVAMRTPLLEAGEEAELARRWRERGDPAALHRLTVAHVRLVVAMAARFRNYGLPMSDLVQEGNVGLMQAAERFEPHREVRFSTYAAWWIRSAIQDYILRNWSIVRTGTTAAQKSLFFNLRRLRAALCPPGEDAGGRDNRARIAAHLGVAEAEVEAMSARLSAADRSLNAPMGEEGESEWQETLPCQRTLPDDEVEAAHDGAARIAWLAGALDRLNARERAIIEARRLTEQAATLEALGRQLGVSKERVRQIEHGALTKLRRALEEAAGDPRAAGLI